MQGCNAGPVVCLQGGPGGAAALALGGALTCSDSVLVGWGGATEDRSDLIQALSCPVAEAGYMGATVKLQGCTVQLHPDSWNPEAALLLRSSHHASLTAAGCKLVGPAPGNAPPEHMNSVATAGANGALSLVSADVW
jgi:hypothetical protein